MFLIHHYQHKMYHLTFQPHFGYTDLIEWKTRWRLHDAGLYVIVVMQHKLICSQNDTMQFLFQVDSQCNSYFYLNLYQKQLLKT